MLQIIGRLFVEVICSDLHGFENIGECNDENSLHKVLMLRDPVRLTAR